MASGGGVAAERSSFVGSRVPDEISKMIKSLNNVNVDKATFRAIVAGEHCQQTVAWASAHRGKWGQLTPLKMDEKLKKSENMQKEQFSMFMLYFESNQDKQVYRTALC